MSSIQLPFDLSESPENEPTLIHERHFQSVLEESESEPEDEHGTRLFEIIDVPSHACVIPIEVGNQVINAVLGRKNMHTLLDGKLYEKMKIENSAIARRELPPDENFNYVHVVGRKTYMPICVVNLPFTFGDNVLEGKEFRMYCVVLENVIPGMVLGRSWRTRYVSQLNEKDKSIILYNPYNEQNHVYDFTKRYDQTANTQPSPSKSLTVPRKRKGSRKNPKNDDNNGATLPISRHHF